jgi:hypothetical protein
MRRIIGTSARSLIVAGLVAGLVPTAASASVRWGKPQVIDAGTQLRDPLYVQSLSCPSEQLCVGVAAGGTVVVSNTPAEGNWQSAVIDPGHNLVGVSCPTMGVCVAWDTSGAIVTSKAPAAAASAWQRTPGVLGSGADSESVSCPSSALCVAVNGADLFTSLDPTGGAGSWPKATLAGTSGLSGVSCPTAAFCAALDPLANNYDGGVFYTTNPGGGGSTWSPGRAAGFPEDINLQSIACASASWCELAGQSADDDYYYVTDYAPGGPPPASAPALRVGPGVNALSCSAVAGCLAADAGGAIYALSSPSARWAKAGSIDPSGTTALTCESAQLCVGATTSGRLGVSQDAFTGSPVWTAGLPLGSKTTRRTLTGVSCGSTVCVATDSAGYALVNTTAAPSAGGWHSEPVSPGNALSLVSCAPAGYCAISSDSSVFSSPTPAGGRWSYVDLDLWDNPDGKSGDDSFETDDIDSLSCGAVSFCAEVSTNDSQGFGIFSGTFAISSQPGTAGWADPKADELLSHTGENQDWQPDWVACASARTCLVEADPTVGVMTAAGKHWRYVTFGGRSGDGPTPAQDGSCPAVSFCAMSGSGGYVFTSTDPTGASAPGWHTRSLDPGRLLAISCASRRLCVAIDLGRYNRYGPNRPSSGVVYTSTDPASPRAVWSRHQTHRQLSGVSCASRGAHPAGASCVVVDLEGEAFVGRLS